MKKAPAKAKIEYTIEWIRWNRMNVRWVSEWIRYMSYIRVRKGSAFSV